MRPQRTRERPSKRRTPSFGNPRSHDDGHGDLSLHEVETALTIHLSGDSVVRHDPCEGRGRTHHIHTRPREPVIAPQVCFVYALQDTRTCSGRFRTPLRPTSCANPRRVPSRRLTLRSARPCRRDGSFPRRRTLHRKCAPRNRERQEVGAHRHAEQACSLSRALHAHDHRAPWCHEQLHHALRGA